jgi:AcrR family transcriptional regulator
MKKEILHIQSYVKDENLVEKRRQQILQASIRLFRQKGFHRATTREIAASAGFSIGTLYEYVRTKEDVLYLICDRIFHKVSEVFEQLSNEEVTIEQLKIAIKKYITLVDLMHDEFTIMYQETKSFPRETIDYVIEKEIEMIGFFVRLIEQCVAQGELNLPNNHVYLAANEILVVGQSWAFRKWALKRHYTLEQFILEQTELFMYGLKRK